MIARCIKKGIAKKKTLWKIILRNKNNNIIWAMKLTRIKYYY